MPLMEGKYLIAIFYLSSSQLAIILCCYLYYMPTCILISFQYYVLLRVGFFVPVDLFKEVFCLYVLLVAFYRYFASILQALSLTRS